MDIRIRENGSADLEYRLAAKELDFVKDNPIDQLRLKAYAEGFKVANYRIGEYRGFRAFKHIANSRQLPDFQRNLFHSGGGQVFITRKGFFSSIYRFKTKVNFLHMSYLADQEIAPVLTKQIQIAFRLSLPGRVVATNADRCLDHGRTVEWMLNTGDNLIYAESEKINWLNIVIVGTLAIAGLMLGYIYFTRGETFSGELKRG
jgi:hypothetical protein